MTDPAGERTTSSAGQRLVASFDTYDAAQELVDRMSDGGFPVEHVRIVGDGLRTVEQVTGRMTKGKAALAGAASGAWIGLLFLLFAVGLLWLWVWVLLLPLPSAHSGALSSASRHTRRRVESVTSPASRPCWRAVTTSM
ncbi:general stress protein [Mycobacterium gastri]|uniref:general stress protein n=1 Tax=Mycobacterium gastri TaxID=1777 RepID=UPI0003E4C2EE|nr:general stress protein [Mycobacterium gastri]ETW22139.1 hypothetical protein MGAST_21775 [Mycobacterium gastri 'Wayne']